VHDESRAVRPPLPPFDERAALLKVRAAEDAWNTRDPELVAAAYTPDSVWRNRTEFVTGRPAIIDLLTRKWERELAYALRKSLWGFRGNRMAVRFQYEWHDRGAATGTSCGSSPQTASWPDARPASTTSPYRPTSAVSSDPVRPRSVTGSFRLSEAQCRTTESAVQPSDYNRIEGGDRHA